MSHKTIMKTLDKIETCISTSEVIALGTSLGDTPNVIVIANKYMQGNTIYIIDVFFNKTRNNMTHNSKVSLATRNKGIGYQIHGCAKKIESKHIPEKMIPMVQGLETFHIRGIEIGEVFEITPHVGIAGTKLYP